jgi:type IV pilus modification protein PilV
MMHSLFGTPAALRKGSGLVEVLVAVLVIAIGVTATLQMFITSSKNSKNSHYRLQTQFYIDDLLSRMRGNLLGVHHGHYVFAPQACSAGVTPAASNVEGEQIAKEDLSIWTTSISQKFGNAFCQVAQSAVNRKRYTVTLGWTEDGSTPDLANCNQNGATICFSVTSLVCANFEAGGAVNACL